MSPVVLALGAMSLFYAGWMRFLGRRAAAGVLGRGAPGIRLPATKVCEHTWAAAQAGRRTPLHDVGRGVPRDLGAVISLLGLIGVTEGIVLVLWLVLAIGTSRVTTLSAAGRDAVQLRLRRSSASTRGHPSRSVRSASTNNKAARAAGAGAAASGASQ